MRSEIQFKLSAMNSVVRRINTLYADWAAAHGTNSMSVEILYYLMVEGEASQKQMRETYGMPKQSINNVVSALRRDGLVELSESESDRREKHVTLTHKGQEYAKQLLEPIFAAEEKTVQEIGTEEMDTLVGDTSRFVSVLEKWLMGQERQ